MVTCEKDWAESLDAIDPRAEIRHVYSYILNRWSHAKGSGDTQRAIHLFQALDTIRAEWPDEVGAFENEYR
jgi:hypothetical protein